MRVTSIHEFGAGGAVAVQHINTVIAVCIAGSADTPFVRRKNTTQKTGDGCEHILPTVHRFVAWANDGA